MTGLKQRIKSAVAPTTIVPKGETQALGRIGANRWLRATAHGRKEFLIGSKLDREDDPRSQGGYVLAERETITDETTGQELVVGSMYYRLDAYELGTYARELEKHRQKRRASARLPRPVDGLRGLHLLAHRPGRIFTEPGAGPGFAGNPNSAYVAGRGPLRGPTAIVAAIEAHGISLSLVQGELVAIAPGGRVPGMVAEVLQAARRMLVAHLDGGARCELHHPGKDAAPEAWTCLEPSGLLACEAHASGELELSGQ